MPFVILSTETYLFIRYENININPNYFNALTSASWGIVWAITGTVYIYTAIKNNIKYHKTGWNMTNCDKPGQMDWGHRYE